MGPELIFSGTSLLLIIQTRFIKFLPFTLKATFYRTNKHFKTKTTKITSDDLLKRTFLPAKPLF